MAPHERDVETAISQAYQHPPRSDISHNGYHTPITTPFTSNLVEAALVPRSDRSTYHEIQPAPSGLYQYEEEEQVDWLGGFGQNHDDSTKNQFTLFDEQTILQMKAAFHGTNQQQHNYSNSYIHSGLGSEDVTPQGLAFDLPTEQNNQPLTTSNDVPISMYPDLQGVPPAIDITGPMTAGVPFIAQGDMIHHPQENNVFNHELHSTSHYGEPSRAPMNPYLQIQQQVQNQPIMFNQQSPHDRVPSLPQQSAPARKRVLKNNEQESTARKRKRQDLSGTTSTTPSTHTTATSSSFYPMPTGSSNPTTGSSGPFPSRTSASAVSSAVSPATALLKVDQDYELAFSSPDEARPYAHRRAKLSISDDDAHEVEASKETWVRKIMAAITHSGYKAPPAAKKSGRALTQQEAEKWSKWQQDHADKVRATLAMENYDIVKEVESQAWLILEEVLEAHKRGYHLTTMRADTESKCSKRLEDGITVLKDYAIVRLDVFDRFHYDEFAASPGAFASRKVQNLWVNNNKPLKQTTIVNTEQGDKGKDSQTEHVAKKPKSKVAELDSAMVQKRFTPAERRSAKARTKKPKGASKDAVASRQQIQPDALQVPANAGSIEYTTSLNNQTSNNFEDGESHVGTGVTISQNVIGLGGGVDDLGFETGRHYPDVGMSANMQSALGGIGGMLTPTGYVTASMHPPPGPGSSRHAMAHASPNFSPPYK